MISCLGKFLSKTGYVFDKIFTIFATFESTLNIADALELIGSVVTRAGRSPARIGRNRLCMCICSCSIRAPLVKHSQYKNDATQLKNFLGLKLPPFFLHRVGDEKRRQFQSQEVFQLNCVVPILTAL